MTSNNITYATVYAEPTPLHEVSSFCVQFWHEALEPEGTNIQLTKAKWWVQAVANECLHKAYAV